MGVFISRDAHGGHPRAGLDSTCAGGDDLRGGKSSDVGGTDMVDCTRAGGGYPRVAGVLIPRDAHGGHPHTGVDSSHVLERVTYTRVIRVLIPRDAHRGHPLTGWP